MIQVSVHIASKYYAPMAQLKWIGAGEIGLNLIGHFRERYRNLHFEHVSRPSLIYNGNPYTNKTVNTGPGQCTQITLNYHATLEQLQWADSVARWESNTFLLFHTRKWLHSQAYNVWQNYHAILLHDMFCLYQLRMSVIPEMMINTISTWLFVVIFWLFSNGVNRNKDRDKWLYS